MREGGGREREGGGREGRRKEERGREGGREGGGGDGKREGGKREGGRGEGGKEGGRERGRETVQITPPRGNMKTLQIMPTFASTFAFSIITTPYLARVRATLRRRASFRNPIPWCSLALTQERMMKSFSLPWNASTLATSISCVGREGATGKYIVHVHTCTCAYTCTASVLYDSHMT